MVAGFSCNGEVHIVTWQHLAEYQQQLFEENQKTKFSFFNLSFDFNVMGKAQWLGLLAQENRILELSTSSKMFFAGTQGWIPGKVTLAYVAKHFLGVELNKEDGTRTSFSRETQLTEQQIRYLAEDCISTELCALQVNNLPTETLQARASFVLGELGFNGMLVDRKHFDLIRGKIIDKMGENLKELRNFGYRIKQSTEDMTQIQRIASLVERIGCSYKVDKAVASSGRSQFPTPALWIWAANILGLFIGSDERTSGGSPVMPSDLKATTDAIMTPAFSPGVDWSSKNKVVTQLKNTATQSIQNYLDTFECGDCIGKSPKAEVALVILEVLMDSFEQDPDNVRKLFEEEFALRYDENLGWLSGTKPKKNSDLIQNHLKGLMAANPGLEFPLTATSAKNTKKYLTECNKKNIQPDPSKLAELAVYACKRNEMWRLTDLHIEDKFLELYTGYKHREKLLSTYLNPETIDTDGRWHSRYNDFLVTGRTSASYINCQNIPREKGLRENVVAPPGCVIVACDYSQEELITLAATLQHRYGKSRMADAINAGLDLHALFAAYRDGKLKDIPLDMLTDQGVVATLKPMLKEYKEDKALKPKRQLAKSYIAWAYVSGGYSGIHTLNRGSW